jgi:hypothetical protein
MDILRNIFGTVTSGVVRLLVSVGILAAAYFFILKPVLHTVDETSKQFNQGLGKSFDDGGLHEISKALEDVNKQVQVQVHRSFHVAKTDGNPNKLIHCVKRANGDVHRIQRCAVKF